MHISQKMISPKQTISVLMQLSSIDSYPIESAELRELFRWLEQAAWSLQIKANLCNNSFQSTHTIKIKCGTVYLFFQQESLGQRDFI